jgi:hypothetical protein
MTDLDTWSLQELRSVAERLAIPHARELSHAELVRALHPRQSEVKETLVDGEDETPPSAIQGLHFDRAHLGSGVGKTGTELPPVPAGYVIPDLPWSYHDDRIVLLARDPRTVFAYWDCHPETVRVAREQMPEGVPMLRLFALGGSEPRVVREVSIDLDGRGWYFYDLDPNREYRLELVLRSPAGVDRLLLRPSNIVALPLNRPSAWIEDRFASLPLDIRLPDAAVFLSGRHFSDVAGRLHGRAYELSLGKTTEVTGDTASSLQGMREGFRGRALSSGQLVRKPV